MGSLKVTLCAGAAVVLAALTPTAYAADGGGVSVTPASPAPGADVALRISGCAGTTGTAASAAFVADARLVGAAGTLAGETRVRTSLEPGSYDVKITCGSVTVKGAITVVADASQSQSQSQPQSQPPSARPSAPAPASPVAPVHAGGGGTAHLAAVDARAAGPGTAHAVVGLLLAGVAAAAVALRSARRSRRTG
ncbi:hypothetical protein ACFWP5_48130 [Streptomyces sp. NPDC058469]|uniref:hypothetical protein n=1 Tax=Streptomyces sp. NPDC058469 TaxID=3346514 RepID=UPI003653E18A